MPDDAFLTEWCGRHLGARPARVLFRSGHLSQVVAAELADGRQVVIKARPSDPRIAGCTAVQEHLRMTIIIVDNFGYGSIGATT